METKRYKGPQERCLHQGNPKEELPDPEDHREK
jgi:hypothetical protein